MFWGAEQRMHARYAKAPEQGKATFEPEYQMVKKVSVYRMMDNDGGGGFCENSSEEP
jgi:hypothetical protein